MPRTSNKILRENAMRVLDYVSEVSTRNRDHVAPLSHKQIASRFNLSIQQVRFLCGRLESQGFIVRRPRYAEDGGQLANGYALTTQGRMALREARRLEVLF